MHYKNSVVWPRNDLAITFGLIHLCRACRSGMMSALGHKLPRRALSRAAAQPPITDTNAGHPRSKSGNLTMFAAMRRASSREPFHRHLALRFSCALRALRGRVRYLLRREQSCHACDRERHRIFVGMEHVSVGV